MGTPVRPSAVMVFPALLSFVLGTFYVSLMVAYPYHGVEACLDLAAIQLGYWAALMGLQVPVTIFAVDHAASTYLTRRPKIWVGVTGLLIVVLSIVTPEVVLVYVR